MKKIILINGSGGVGKDTFIDLCGHYTLTKNISTVDKIKKAAMILGWDGTKSEINRLFLSNLKLLSVKYLNHSYNYVKEQIELFENEFSPYNVLFIHVREPDELHRFSHEFNAHTLLIRNKNIPIITTNMADKNVDNYLYDFIIDNDEGLHEFKVKAKNFVELLKKYPSQD